MPDYTVTVLDLSKQKLMKLPNDLHLYTQLQILNCSNNHLITLDRLPSTLQKLDCSNNRLTSLDHLPPSLQELSCYQNQLTSLDHLPSKLHDLYCSDNQIISLDQLPSTLHCLECANNRLSSLDHLPTTLEILCCEYNQITSFDHLPNSLQELYCAHNQLTSLDKLPSTLFTLRCDNNKISSLNHLPSSLSGLHCSNNPLKYQFDPTLKNIRFQTEHVNHVNHVKSLINDETFRFDQLQVGFPFENIVEMQLKAKQMNIKEDFTSIQTILKNQFQLYAERECQKRNEDFNFIVRCFLTCLIIHQVPHKTLHLNLRPHTLMLFIDYNDIIANIIQPMRNLFPSDAITLIDNINTCIVMTRSSGWTEDGIYTIE